MRVFIAVLVLIFSFQTWTKADDISDFEIEGMSIGDSLLNFVTSEYIDNEKPFFYPKSKKFKEYEVNKELLLYDMIQATVKSTDKKYIIYSMMGDIFYKENFNDCIKKKAQVLKDIINVVGEFDKKEDDRYKRRLDKSGKSYDESTTIYFKNDIENCLKKQKSISKSIKQLIGDHTKYHPLDKTTSLRDSSGNSFLYSEGFTFYENESMVQIYCTNWSKDFEKKDWHDELKVAIWSDSFSKFLETEAY